jgi:hypothetical protein
MPMTTPTPVFHSQAKSPVTVTYRWTKERVLMEARRRTHQLSVENTIRLQSMLADLMVESGWIEHDFISVLCADIANRTPRC